MQPKLRHVLPAPLLLTAGAYSYLFARKRLHYRGLRALQRRIVAEHDRRLRFAAQSSALPSFERRLAVVPELLDAQTFAQLRELGLAHSTSERSYIPTHKKGGTVAYETLHMSAPQIVALYLAPRLHALIGQLVGEPVQPTPLHDQSSCSLLCYTQPGDHIEWHYDHNFYNGRHFTLLLPLVNRHNQTGRPSSAQLLARRGEEELVVPTDPNSMILFEGAQVRHKVTRLGPDETRIMLSMTFCTDPSASTIKAAGRRIKDTAFYGLRALWT